MKQDKSFKTFTILSLSLLFFASLVSTAMYLVRVVYSGNLTYLFLMLNLCLAWLPLIFAILVYKSTRRVWLQGVFGFLWLIFLPNAPYILTDLLHLRFYGVPLWYDLIMIISFAFTGLLLGFLSLSIMQALITRWLGRVMGWLFVLASLGLSGVGVYIGRFLRWNSWDILLNPFTLLRSLIDPNLFLQGFVVSLLLGTILVFTYAIFFSLPRLSVALVQEAA